MDQGTLATNEFYKLRNSHFVYPVEFVVRVLLGRYSALALDKSTFRGSRILDLGYGDGRNMPLLANLGFQVFGVEVSDQINQMAEERLEKLKVEAVLKTGRNVHIPFEDGFFDYVLACHSCYYVDEGTTFDNSIDEIARVMSSRGVFICSLPMHDTYILQDAEVLSDGYYRIVNDPYNYRKGTIFRAFKTKDEVHQALASRFEDICIGFCDDDFFGVHQKVWIVVLQEKSLTGV